MDCKQHEASATSTGHEICCELTNLLMYIGVVTQRTVAGVIPLVTTRVTTPWQYSKISHHCNVRARGTPGSCEGEGYHRVATSRY